MMSDLFMDNHYSFSEILLVICEYEDRKIIHLNWFQLSFYKNRWPSIIKNQTSDIRHQTSKLTSG